MESSRQYLRNRDGTGTIDGSSFRVSDMGKTSTSHTLKS